VWWCGIAAIWVQSAFTIALTHLTTLFFTWNKIRHRSGPAWTGHQPIEEPFAVLSVLCAVLCTWRWYLECTRVGEASKPGPNDDREQATSPVPSLGARIRSPTEAGSVAAETIATDGDDLGINCRKVNHKRPIPVSDPSKSADGWETFPADPPEIFHGASTAPGDFEPPSRILQPDPLEMNWTGTRDERIAALVARSDLRAAEAAPHDEVRGAPEGSIPDGVRLPAPGPNEDDDEPSMETVSDDAATGVKPFCFLSWNIHGLENHLDQVLAMQFDVLALQEADVEESSVYMIKQRCAQARVHIFFPRESISQRRPIGGLPVGWPSWSARTWCPSLLTPTRMNST
jgi:hypothetical protein